MPEWSELSHGAFGWASGARLSTRAAAVADPLSPPSPEGLWNGLLAIPVALEGDPCAFAPPDAGRQPLDADDVGAVFRRA